MESIRKIGLFRNENNGSAFVANSMEMKQKKNDRAKAEAKKEEWNE